ncbi:uncharacterized protein V1510DRAFT_414363 [Dipodascopsis tothii]|uniref:uncharacterized protein n=1 Tax=Dipodascopsis tothii TaxID=44089 RepID=UPI0034CD9603
MAPFPSTAESEQLLMSKMDGKSRAALVALLRRNPNLPRPPRFRPPVSQNMGYGAIQRHPFYGGRRYGASEGPRYRAAAAAPPPSFWAGVRAQARAVCLGCF